MIKFGKNMNSKKENREFYGVFASIIGICSNFLLFITKVLIGFLFNSIAITIDGFNNLIDSSSSVISLLSFKLSKKPADKEHPFGHGRIEYIAAVIISFLTVLFGYQFAKDSLNSILQPEPINISNLGIVVLIITVIEKIWESKFYKVIGEKINSKTLIASSIDSKNDVFITGATIISVIFTNFTGIIIDGYIGIFVSISLLWSGYKMSKDNLSILVGEPPSDDLVRFIKETVEKNDKILGSHDLIVHNYGPDNFISTIHVEVSNKVSFQEAHDIVDDIEKKVLEDCGINLLIHLDPVDVEDKRLKELMVCIKSFENKFSDLIQIHDCRIIDASSETKVVFDLMVSYKCSKIEENILKYEISRKIRKINPNYIVLPQVEKGNIGDN